MKKRQFTYIALALTVAFMGSFFAPFYQVNVKTAEEVYGYMTSPWVAFYKLEGNLFLVSSVFFLVYMILMLGGVVMYVVSCTSKDEQSDREDKFFVFASFLCAISSAFYALMCVGIGSFIPLILAILYAIGYVVMIFIHNKYLTEY